MTDVEITPQAEERLSTLDDEARVLFN